MICRFRVPLPVVQPAYDELLDRPTGYLVVDARGREVARYPRFLERAKRSFDLAGFGAGYELLRLPDRRPVARRVPMSRRDFADF